MIHGKEKEIPNEIITLLVNLLDDSSSNVTKYIVEYLELIAQLCHFDFYKNELIDKNVVKKIMDLIPLTNNSISLFKALGNLALENNNAQQMILESGKVKDLLESFSNLIDQELNRRESLKDITESCAAMSLKNNENSSEATTLTEISSVDTNNAPDNESNSKRLEPAKTIVNEKQDENTNDDSAFKGFSSVASSNDKLKKELVKHGTIDLMIKYISNCDTNAPDIACSCVDVLSWLTEEETGRKMLVSDILPKIIKIIITNERNVQVRLELIQMIETKLSQSDELKKVLLTDKHCDTLVNYVNNTISNTSFDAVCEGILNCLVFIVSDDMCSDQLFEEKLLYKICSQWLDYNNLKLSASAALIIGNFARSDARCIQFVNDGIHVSCIKKIEMLKNYQESELNCLVGFLSVLKNMCVPATNKPIMVQSGCLEIVTSLAFNENQLVQLKSFSILRLLSLDVSAFAFLTDTTIFNNMVRLSVGDSVTGSNQEAQRTVCNLFKLQKDIEQLKIMLNNDSLKVVKKLLGASHFISKNESVAVFVHLLSFKNQELNRLAGFPEILQLITNEIDKNSHPLFIYNALTLLMISSEFYKSDVSTLFKTIDWCLQHSAVQVKTRTEELKKVIGL